MAAGRRDPLSDATPFARGPCTAFRGKVDRSRSHRRQPLSGKHSHRARPATTPHLPASPQREHDTIPEAAGRESPRRPSARTNYGHYCTEPVTPCSTTDPTQGGVLQNTKITTKHGEKSRIELQETYKIQYSKQFLLYYKILQEG